MSVLLFSGSHARHVYVHEQIIESDAIDVDGIVAMERESTLPDPPAGWPERDRRLFEEHFRRRDRVEREVYGERSIDVYEDVAPTRYVGRDELNSPAIADFVRDVDPDACFVFGTGLILDPVLSELPEWTLNFHLGLSPQYRGSATLFWPFYFLEPQYAGGTLHKIVEEPDAGAIVHQTTPELEYGDGVHDVGAKTVVRFAEETVPLLERLAERGSLPSVAQSSGGKLFLSDDFDPHHLRVVYELYDDDVVDAYLDGNLGASEPDLVDAFDRIESE